MKRPLYIFGLSVQDLHTYLNNLSAQNPLADAMGISTENVLQALYVIQKLFTIGSGAFRRSELFYKITRRENQPSVCSY